MMDACPATPEPVLRRHRQYGHGPLPAGAGLRPGPNRGGRSQHAGHGRQARRCLLRPGSTGCALGGHRAGRRENRVATWCGCCVEPASPAASCAAPAAPESTWSSSKARACGHGDHTFPSSTAADGERLVEHVRSLLPGRKWLIVGEPARGRGAGPLRAHASGCARAWRPDPARRQWPHPHGEPGGPAYHR